MEARSNRPLEEGAKLHTRDDSKFRILLESEPVADRPNTKIPWFLVAASMVLLLLVLYVLFVGYLPSKQRVAGLEAELKDLYKREADLQTRIVSRLSALSSKAAEAGEVALMTAFEFAIKVINEEFNEDGER